jgi:hypothetical protein
MEGIETCSLCGIRKFAGQFRWGHTGQVASPDAVYSRVCGVAKDKGVDVSDCINEIGVMDKNLRWKEISPEFIDALIEGSAMALNNMQKKEID